MRKYQAGIRFFLLRLLVISCCEFLNPRRNPGNEKVHCLALGFRFEKKSRPPGRKEFSGGIYAVAWVQLRRRHCYLGPLGAWRFIDFHPCGWNFYDFGCWWTLFPLPGCDFLPKNVRRFLDVFSFLHLGWAIFCWEPIYWMEFLLYFKSDYFWI